MVKVKLKLPKPKFRFKSATEEDGFVNDDEQPSAGGRKLALLSMSKMSPVIARVGGIIALPKRLVGRRPSYIVVAAAALLVLLVLVPFETFVGDRELVIRIHVALGSAVIGLVVWRFLVAKDGRSGELLSESVDDEISEQRESVTPDISTVAKIEEKEEQQAPEYIKIRYNCGHSIQMPRTVIEEWIRQKSIPNLDLSTGIIEITVMACQHCVKQHMQAPAGTTAAQIEKQASTVVAPVDRPKSGKKKKKMMMAAAAAAVIMVVGVFGSGSGPVSGLIDPIKERVCGMVGGLNPGGMLPGTPSVPDFSESLPSEIPEGLPPSMTQLPDTSGGLPGMSGVSEDVPGIQILNSFCGTG